MYQANWRRRNSRKCFLVVVCLRLVESDCWQCCMAMHIAYPRASPRASSRQATTLHLISNLINLFRHVQCAGLLDCVRNKNPCLGYEKWSSMTMQTGSNIVCCRAHTMNGMSAACDGNPKHRTGCHFYSVI